jgi:acyl-CoA thioester hydrolase
MIVIQYDTNIRVCYGDTDKGGVVYYGTYPRYYEVSRTELLRHYGITYREIEEKGLVWPVRSLHITYLKPAFYDELLRVRSIIEELPTVRFKIKTEIYNSRNELINQGEVVLASTNPRTGRVMKTPTWLLDKLAAIIGE